MHNINLWSKNIFLIIINSLTNNKDGGIATIPTKDAIQSQPVFSSISNNPVTDFIFLLE